MTKQRTSTFTPWSSWNTTATASTRSPTLRKPGYEGRHNLIYWDCGDYLGLGPAAHSCMGGRRFYYPADTEAFL